jgi:ribosome-associated protein
MATRKTLARKATPAKSAKSAKPGKIAKKKGGPLRSKKPGKNQIALPKRSLRPKALADAAQEFAPAPVERPDAARPRAMLIAEAGLEKKAEDVLVLDVRGLSSYADYIVVMTADSDRQAGAIADAVDDRLSAEGATKVGVEGYESGRWVLVDYGDVVAHVFNREARGFYDLEGLWADAPRFSVEG